jgi:hypothetical protein
LSDQALPRLAERDDRRREPAAFSVLDDRGLVAFHDGDNGIGRSQVDTDDFAHVSSIKVECVRVKGRLTKAL